MPLTGPPKLGVLIGFRKGAATGGTWIGCTRDASGTYQFTSLGSDATKEYDEASREIAKWAEELAKGVQNDRKLTVADVCRAYVANRRIEKGVTTAYDVQKRFERYVFSETCAIRKGEKMPSGRKKHVEAFVYDRRIGDIPFAKLQPGDVQQDQL
ncbi:hypothetical protein [Paraburkholderia sp. BCC1886]|uniref:hypothetical protein n=1 Tax=Paraburkholderia sp. BCC1886 TaxID=2562670 RepID=UPI0011828599|nr:hypothetical protein [Paraburkholderia sp. BCC1886]